MYAILNTVTDTTHRHKYCYSDTKFYDTLHGAKVVSTKLTKKTGQHHVPITMDELKLRPVKMKKVRNLMSGVEIEIAEDTPRSCDPSSELYWSM